MASRICASIGVSHAWRVARYREGQFLYGTGPSCPPSPILSIEDFVHFLRRPCDNRSIPTHTHGPIHYFGMCPQQADQSIGRIVVFNIEAEIAKGSRVNEILWLALEQVEKPPQRLFAGRGLQIFDDVELDVAVAENLQRTV